MLEDLGGLKGGTQSWTERPEATGAGLWGRGAEQGARRLCGMQTRPSARARMQTRSARRAGPVFPPGLSPVGGVLRPHS